MVGAGEWTLLFLFVVDIRRSMGSDTFTSLTSIKELLNKEADLVSTISVAIKTRIQDAEELASSLTDSLKDRPNQKLSHSELIDHLNHPTNILHFIKKWATVQDELNSFLSMDMLNEVQINNGLILPTEEDYLGAATAIVRLQRTYKLPTKEVRQGVISGVLGEGITDQEDMLAIATQALQYGYYGLALEWTEWVQDRDDNEEDMELIEFAEEVRYDAKKKVRELKGCSEDSEECPHEEWIWEPVNDSFDSKLYEDYEKLCRDDHTDTEHKKKQMYCRYKRGYRIPFAVYKEEVFSIDPHVSIFYDVISDSEAMFVKKTAFPNMHRAKVGLELQEETLDHEGHTDIRISKTGWLSDDTPRIKALSHRVSGISWLDANPADSEHFQIVNYGIGGQYEPHVDIIEEDETSGVVLESGDRMATFMFYLSDVTLGGATVFPELNIRIPPIKNAAAFWYNFKPNGDKDMRSIHAGCPVVLGEKWVANKWILQHGQLFRRRCPVDQQAIDGQKG